MSPELESTLKNYYDQAIYGPSMFEEKFDVSLTASADQLRLGVPNLQRVNSFDPPQRSRIAESPHNTCTLAKAK